MQEKNKKIMIGFVFVIIIAIGCFGIWKGLGSSSDSFDMLMSQAQSYKDAGNYADAVTKVEEALAKKPNDETALALKGDLCTLLGDYDSAIDSYQKAYEATERNEYITKRTEVEGAVELNSQQSQLAREHETEYGLMSGTWDSGETYTVEFNPYDRYFVYTSPDEIVEFNGDAVLTRGETGTYTVASKDGTQSFQVSFDPNNNDSLSIDGREYQRIAY